MKQSRIDHRVEKLLRHRKVEGVGDFEARIDATPFRFGLSLADRGGRTVNPRCGESVLGQEEDVFTGPTSDIQDRPANLATLGKPHDHGLWAPDVPWGRSLVGGFEPIDTHADRLVRLRAAPGVAACCRPDAQR